MDLRSLLHASAAPVARRAAPQIGVFGWGQSVPLLAVRSPAMRRNRFLGGTSGGFEAGEWDGKNFGDRANPWEGRLGSGIGKRVERALRRSDDDNAGPSEKKKIFHRGPRWPTFRCFARRSDGAASQSIIELFRSGL